MYRQKNRMASHSFSDKDIPVFAIESIYPSENTKRVANKSASLTDRNKVNKQQNLELQKKKVNQECYVNQERESE